MSFAQRDATNKNFLHDLNSTSSYSFGGRWPHLLPIVARQDLWRRRGDAPRLISPSNLQCCTAAAPRPDAGALRVAIEERTLIDRTARRVARPRRCLSFPPSLLRSPSTSLRSGASHRTPRTQLNPSPSLHPLELENESHISMTGWGVDVVNKRCLFADVGDTCAASTRLD